MSTFPVALTALGYTEGELELDNPYNGGSKMTADELADMLGNYYGTDNWYRHPLNKAMLYTDGVQAFAEAAGAYWLLDIIATELAPKAGMPGTEFLSIRLIVAPDSTARLIADDGDDAVVYRKAISFTDCPEGTWSFYFTDNVLMLVTEY